MDNYGYNPEESSNGRPFTISRGLDSANKQNNENDFYVAINSRFKPVKKEIYYKRATLILICLVVLLLIGLLVLIILYLKPGFKGNLCITNKCIRTAANLKYSMNFSMDPCEDFYEFCCGKWSIEHPNHGWYTTFSTFSTISEKILLESLEVLSKKEVEDEPLSVSQAKWFYQSCMDTDSIDSLGLKPLYKYLKAVNLPVLPDFFNNISNTKDTKFDWIKSEVLIKTVLAMDLFVGFTVGPNIFKRDQNVIYVGVLFQSCPLPSPLKRKHYIRQPWKRQLQQNLNTISSHSTNKTSDDDDYDTDEAEETLRNMIRSNMIKLVTKRIVEDIGGTQPEDTVLQRAIEVINNITDFIDEINGNFTVPEGESEYEKTRKYSIQELQDLTDNNVKTSTPNFWMDYIGRIFENTNVTIARNDSVFIVDVELEYLYTVLEYVSSQPSEHLELYMWWATVYSMVINLSSDLADEVLTQASMFYQESKDQGSVYARSRSITCCELVNTYMGWAVSYAVADKSFANKTKPKVEKMINDIKAAFVDHVKTLKWMDKDTKKVTLEKTEEMLSLVGYPDWLFKDGAVDRKYEGLEINSTTYLDNMVNTIIISVAQTLTSLRIPNPRDWTTEAIVVNAYNSFGDNSINVPMAILNYPVYDLGLEVLNYGSIGSIIGHELTHGFDNTGRKHDKYGNYIQWWPNKTIETFENMTQCFINQYDNYTIDGVKGHVKGKVTLGENLADNGGLSQAYTAYKRFQKRNGLEPKLPGFENYKDDQLFFIAYGSIWCETPTVKDLQDQIEYDEHAPNSLRVIGTLQNSPEFSRAFNCPKKSYMNPEKSKCKIW